MIISVTVILLALIGGGVYLVRTVLVLQRQAMESGLNYAIRYNQQIAEQTVGERVQELKVTGAVSSDVGGSVDMEESAGGWSPDDIPIVTGGGNRII